MGEGLQIIEASDAAALIPLVREAVESSVSPGDRISVPTGRTPEPLYRSVRENWSRAIWRMLRYIQLDEYIDPPPGTETFAKTLAKQLFEPLEIAEEARGSIRDPGNPEEGPRMDRLLEKEPLKLCLLGLGSNGHVAFNEPGDQQSGYHRVELAPETIAANFPREIAEGRSAPIEALTIGLDQVLAAARVLLWVPQREKQPLLDRVLAGPVDPALPATALLGHRDLVVFRVASNR
jgi:glucosamine-6-phosphate deaminase